jgi:catechol 2,3-dioxygenase-like lactoylglutathione lyase family enzyme
MPRTLARYATAEGRFDGDSNLSGEFLRGGRHGGHIPGQKFLDSVDRQATVQNDLFLGMDHSAISGSDTARSLAFYRKLGLRVNAQTLNIGPEQQCLDDLDRPEVKVTALALPDDQPHLELLCHLNLTRVAAPVPRNNDVAAARTVFEMAPEQATSTRWIEICLRDPDGHHVQMISGTSESKRATAGEGRNRSQGPFVRVDQSWDFPSGIAKALFAPAGMGGRVAVRWRTDTAIRKAPNWGVYQLKWMHAVEILLLGVEADAPDAELGYIVPENVYRDGVSPISEFVEKPTLPRAEAFIERGALWNAFIFAAKGRVLPALFERRFPKIGRDMRRAVRCVMKARQNATPI